MWVSHWTKASRSSLASLFSRITQRCPLLSVLHTQFPLESSKISGDSAPMNTNPLVPSYSDMFWFFMNHLEGMPLYHTFRIDVSVPLMQVDSDKPLHDIVINWLLDSVSRNEGIPDEFHGYLVAARLTPRAYAVHIGVMDRDRVNFFHYGRLDVHDKMFYSDRPTTYPAAEVGIQGAWVKTSHRHQVPLILVDIPSKGEILGEFSFRPDFHRYDRYFNDLHKRVQDSPLEFTSPDGIYEGILNDIQEIAQIPLEDCLSTVCCLQDVGNIVVVVEGYENVYNIFDAYTNGVVRVASVSFKGDDAVTLHSTEPFSIQTLKMLSQ